VVALPQQSLTRSLVTAATVLLGVGCGPARSASPPRPGFADKLDAAVQDAQAKREMPAIGLEVVQGDRVVYSRGYGKADLASGRPMTDTTPTVIGSTSKPLTALAVLRLVQLGKVALDTPIVRYLPDLEFKDPRASAITLRQLLTNRSGFTVGFSGPAWERPLAAPDDALERQAREIAAMPLDFAPGQGYRYSNRGWTLAGYLVQKVSGIPIETFLRTEVFEPLGMTQTTLEFWKVPDLVTGYSEGRLVRNHVAPPSLSRGYGPSGMIVSTPRDMGRLLVALLNDGKTVSGTQFLTPELIHEAMRPQAEAESELGGPTHYGLGWEIDSTFGQLTVKKAGSVGTMVSFWVMLPTEKVGLAFTFNREDYAILPLVPAVLKVIAGGDAPPFPPAAVTPLPPPAAVPVKASVLARWMGRYDTRSGDLPVYRRGDSLFAFYEGLEAAMAPSNDSTFTLVDDRIKVGGKAIGFRRQGGTITVWDGKDSTGVKIRGAAGLPH